MITNSPPLFAPEQIKQLYPIDEYYRKPTPKRVEHYRLHFLIAHGAKKDLIAKFCSPENISKLDPRAHLFSPLHLAVLLKNIPVIETILEKAKEAKYRLLHLLADKYGWKHYQHMVWHDEETIQKMRKIFAKYMKMEGLTWTGLSLNHLLGFTGKGECNLAARKVSIRKPCGEKVHIANISNRELQELTGLGRYWPFPIFVHVPDKLWKTEKVPPPLYQLLPSSWEKDLPPLCIQVNESGEVSLAAESLIPAGGIITEYAGLKGRRAGSASFYYVGDVDGHEIGNEGRFISYGFPNAKVWIMRDGGLERLIIYALRKIETGEPITISKSVRHPLSLRGEKLFRKKEMFGFFAGRSMEEWKHYSVSSVDPTKWKQEEIYQREVWDYFISSPVALFFLHLHSLAKVADILGLLKEALLSPNSNPPKKLIHWSIQDQYSLWPGETRQLIWILQQLREWDAYMENEKDGSLFCNSLILESLNDVPVLGLLSSMEEMKSYLQGNSVKTQEELKKFWQQSLEKQNAYDWRKDPDGKTLWIDQMKDLSTLLDSR